MWAQRAMWIKSILILVLVVGVSSFAPSFGIPRVPSNLGASVDTSDIKNGLTIELDGEPYKVLSFSTMKQARGAAKTTIKFKNLMRGSTIENTYRSGHKFEKAMIEKVAHQFTYSDSGTFYFMNSETFVELAASSNVVGDSATWLEPGLSVDLVLFKGECIEVVVPRHGIYEVVETEPVVKGSTKPATLSCGATITVPGYIDQGEQVKVDTEKGAFVERAK